MFFFGQKYVIAYPHSYLKRVKTLPNSKNSRSYPKKTVGWALNYGTHFSCNIQPPAHTVQPKIGVRPASRSLVWVDLKTCPHLERKRESDVATNLRSKEVAGIH